MILTRTFPYILGCSLCLAGCDAPGEGDMGLCEEAVTRIEQCTGVPANPAECTEDVAETVLSYASCEELLDTTEDAGKADDGECGWVARSVGLCEEPMDGEAPMDGEEPMDQGEPTEPWAGALDVHRAVVDVSAEGPPPEPEGFGVLIGDADDERAILLNGPEFRQRWTDGYEGYGWEQGSDHGRACTHAGTLRLHAIWSYVDDTGARPGRDVFAKLAEERDFRYTMYHWVEDVSQGGNNTREAGIWGWQDLLKWTSVARADGTCALPTLEQVLELPQTCHPDLPTIAHCTVPSF